MFSLLLQVFVVERKDPLLRVSVMLHVSALLTDHNQS